MRKGIPVYSVVAYSGTGKTTLLEKLIPEFKKRGLRVAVVKHDAHEFQIDHEGKDSWRMTAAGADVTIVACQSHAAIMENRYVDTETLLSRVTDVDLILTEGFKHGNYPKIGVFREAAGKPLPDVEDGYLAVLSDVPLKTDAPCLDINDIAGLADMLILDMQKNNNG